MDWQEQIKAARRGVVPMPAQQIAAEFSQATGAEQMLRLLRTVGPAIAASAGVASPAEFWTKLIAEQGNAEQALNALRVPAPAQAVAALTTTRTPFDAYVAE